MSKLKNERFDQPMEFNQYLGHLDLERHPLWEKAWVGQDQTAFETVLNDLGADLSYGYDFNVCLYRSRMTNKVEYGMRVSFRERTDKAWMNSMMDVSDIIRTVKCSIRATGMREAMNEDTPLYEAMVEQAARTVTLADIKVDMSEDTK